MFFFPKATKVKFDSHYMIVSLLANKIINLLFFISSTSKLIALQNNFIFKPKVLRIKRTLAGN